MGGGCDRMGRMGVKQRVSSVWATRPALGADSKRLDGYLGMTAMLHTWGQTLMRHVNLHGLVPHKPRTSAYIDPQVAPNSPCSEPPGCPVSAPPSLLHAPDRISSTDL